MNQATLAPILKRPDMASTMPKSLNVSFDIPSENSDLVEYLKFMTLEESSAKLNMFLKVLLSGDTEDSILINWFKQLKDNIIILDKENERVVKVLLDMPWTSRSLEVTTVYHELILNLVSAHVYYLRSVLVMIIKIFMSAQWDSNLENAARSESYKKAHSLLQNIVALVPIAPNMLCFLLFEMFPYVRKPTHVVVAYTVNILNICSYLPSHRLSILEHLFDKVLQIDVHCPKDTIELYELEKEENDQNLVGTLDMTVPTTEMAYPLANTLDQVMSALFNFVRCTCYTGGGDELNWEVTKKLYREILTAFDKFILPTYHCYHLQFIMFYVCSLRSPLSEGFIDYLWKKVKTPNVSPVLRQAAAFYIGSLLARATYINISTASACLDLMCGWLHSYISNHDALSSCDIGTHGPFYSVCQTVFYVFAFRHKDFISMKHGFKNLKSLNFERIVTCRLNPLKFCQTTIVQNFASIARNYQIAYCYPVIERNNRSLLSSENMMSLNTYFPFDPYILKKSKSFIEHLYRLYDATNDDDTMDQDEGSFMDDSQMQDRNDDLFSYSSSPGFKQNRHLSPK